MLVTRFVKDVFERRPSLPRYKEIWDINSVLKVLATWNLGVDVSLRDMSWQLTMLLALLSSQRVQTLKALTLTSMTLIANNCVFTIETPLTTTRPGQHLGRSEFLAYGPDRNMCVVQHLQAYIDGTSHLRGETDQFLIEYLKQACVKCIARWPKQELTLVYIKHIAQEQPPHQLQRGNRSLLTLLSTFARFYDKPIQDTTANVGNELLNSSCKILLFTQLFQPELFTISLMLLLGYLKRYDILMRCVPCDSTLLLSVLH